MLKKRKEKKSQHDPIVIPGSWRPRCECLLCHESSLGNLWAASLSQPSLPNMGVVVRIKWERGDWSCKPLWVPPLGKKCCTNSLNKPMGEHLSMLLLYLFSDTVQSSRNSPIQFPWFSTYKEKASTPPLPHSWVSCSVMSQEGIGRHSHVQFKKAKAKTGVANKAVRLINSKAEAAKMAACKIKMCATKEKCQKINSHSCCPAVFRKC